MSNDERDNRNAIDDNATEAADNRAETCPTATTPEEVLTAAAHLYDVPRDQCVIVAIRVDRHRDECDDGPTCAGYAKEWEIVTVAYPGRARGVYDGPYTATWHSTWGREVGASAFELYAD